MKDAENQNIENENLSNSTQKNKNRHQKIWIAIGVIFITLIITIIVLAKLNEDNCIEIEKPIIYLYPEQELEISLKLGNPENITCSYPKYNNGWNIIAKPDGTLIDIETSRKLYSLYWEGIYSEKTKLDEGFVVKDTDTIKFLEEKLAILGLNERETEEFIIYWLPILQQNKYNYIRFATLKEINNIMPLNFSVEPDTLIRVLMQYKPLEKSIEVKEQKLVTPERNGFIAVEWGGTEIK